MRPRPLVSGLTLLPALLLAAPRVQAPDAAWITFTTPHYRIHCPKAFESFGQEVAGRVEGIHAQYLGLVGFTFEARGKPLDILILDPVMEANGMALPTFLRPHVVLWKTEPEMDSPIGHHRGWAELLVAHELGHMHHLLRPARHPNLWQRWFRGPLVQKSPRWMTEGYATYLEGKLTGSGRPHSALRASVLRQWAMEGKLPSYEALSGGGGFMGGSLAYLGGSAYLEWLEAKAGDPKVFQTLWIRMAGRRDFEAAFRATFGFGPKEGYQRFCAELTHTALELERRVKAEGAQAAPQDPPREAAAGAEAHRRAKRDGPQGAAQDGLREGPQGAAQDGLREGDLFTQLKGWASDLSISPDGSQLLARVLDPDKPGLYVWDLKAPQKAHPKGAPDPREPKDLAPLTPILPPARRLGPIHGALPRKPLWAAPDAINFILPLPNAEGVLQPQSWQWTFGRGQAPAPRATSPANTALAWREVEGVWNLVDAEGRPLTRTLAAAWNPVATPDGRWIYYTQLSASGLQIRRLDATLPPLEPRPLPQDPAALVKDQVVSRADEPSPLSAPVAVAPHPYRAGESMVLLPRFGGSDSPSGHHTELGVGGNDLVGRLNWQLLAGLGDGSGPRGAMLGAAWRGWRWAPSLHAFSTLERPSAQAFLPVPGFDRERRGAELAITREDLGRPRLHLRPMIATERVAMAHGTPSSRTLLGVEAGLGNHWSAREQGFQVVIKAREQQGRTQDPSGGQTWTLSRLVLRAAWDNPWLPLSLEAEGGRLGGHPTALDAFHLGGLNTSLLPGSLDANRVLQAALPAYTATGTRLQRLRGELDLGPVRAYLEQAALWNAGIPRPAAARVLGLELDHRDLHLPMDLLRRLFGNLSFTLGLHRPLDGAMKDRTVGTLSVIVRP